MQVIDRILVGKNDSKHHSLPEKAKRSMPLCKKCKKTRSSWSGVTIWQRAFLQPTIEGSKIRLNAWLFPWAMNRILSILLSKVLDPKPEFLPWAWNSRTAKLSNVTFGPKVHLSEGGQDYDIMGGSRCCGDQWHYWSLITTPTFSTLLN